MNERSALWVTTVGVGLLLSIPAMAHIEYYDLNQGRQIGDLTAAGKTIAGNDIPISNPAYWTSTYQSPISSGETWTSLGGSYASGAWGYKLHVTNLDSSGWTDGLRSNPNGGANLLGDSHKADFANFHLAQASFVSITFSDDQAGTGFGLNPSFSIYKGSAVYQAHDGSSVDPLNPVAATPPFPKVQNAKDTGTIVDSQGITSAYRNTLTNTGLYYGQFNALASWSVGNAAGDWSAVQYITSVTGYVNPSGDWTGECEFQFSAGLLSSSGGITSSASAAMPRTRVACERALGRHVLTLRHRHQLRRYFDLRSEAGTGTRDLGALAGRAGVRCCDRTANPVYTGDVTPTFGLARRFTVRSSSGTAIPESRQ